MSSGRLSEIPSVVYKQDSIQGREEIERLRKSVCNLLRSQKMETLTARYQVRIIYGLQDFDVPQQWPESKGATVEDRSTTKRF